MGTKISNFEQYHDYNQFCDNFYEFMWDNICFCSLNILIIILYIVMIKQSSGSFSAIDVFEQILEF